MHYDRVKISQNHTSKLDKLFLKTATEFKFLIGSQNFANRLILMAKMKKLKKNQHKSYTFHQAPLFDLETPRW